MLFYAVDAENSVETIFEGKDCSYFSKKFSFKDYGFDPASNSTFYVNVYNFEAPFWIVVSVVAISR